MTPEILYIVILTIVIIGFFFDQILGYLNASWFNKPVPEILSDVYDAKKYRRQQEYKLENYRFGIISGVITSYSIHYTKLYEAVSWGFNSHEILEKQNPDALIDTPDEFRITSYNVCYTKLLRPARVTRLNFTGGQLDA